MEADASDANVGLSMATRYNDLRVPEPRARDRIPPGRSQKAGFAGVCVEADGLAARAADGPAWGAIGWNQQTKHSLMLSPRDRAEMGASGRRLFEERSRLGRDAAPPRHGVPRAARGLKDEGASSHSLVPVIR